MPTRRKQPDPQPLPNEPPQQTTRMYAKDDMDVSDTESYFSSKNEPEYLTRLTLAVANGARRRNRPFRHPIRPVKHGEHINDGPTSPAPTVRTFSLKSGETCFRYIVSEDIEGAEDDLKRTDSSKDRPPTQSGRRQRSNSGVSDALPQIQSPPTGLPNSQYVAYDDLDSDSDDDDSLKSLEAGFLSPHQRRRAQFDGQRSFSSSQRLRGYALRPSKSTVNISSPALANRLGVPLSAELEIWVDDLKK